MMKARDVLYFDDISPFNEEVFGFPVLGKISLRQIGLIGFGAMVSWIIYTSTQSLAGLAPLGFFAFLAIRKYHVISTESQMVGIMKFLFGSKKQQKPTKKKPSKFTLVKQGSKKLGVSSEFTPKLDVVGKEVPTRDIFTNPEHPVRLQVRLETPEGKPISKTKTQIEIDGKIIATMVSTINGEIEVVFVPGNVGEKRLVMYAEGFDLPVFENILNIKSL